MTSSQPVLGLVGVSGEREKGMRGLENALKGRIWKLGSPVQMAPLASASPSPCSGEAGGEEGNLENAGEVASKH